MNYEMLNLLEKNANASASSSGGGLIMIILIYAVIFGAMYFIFIRPKRKQQKAEQKMRENLQVGYCKGRCGDFYRLQRCPQRL